ncbi:MAG: 4Fe-4S dicluster domain-containing protein [Candidatus Omnitrophica bacterium]|nr:4Fe-4S dicluster domain-containing protein [Candidatus Omnitrophota bacterium]
MKGILTDVTRCIGCDKCKEACYSLHNQGEITHPSQDAGDDLSEMNWTTVVLYDHGRVYVPGREYDNPPNVTDKNVKEFEQSAFVRKQCLHCLNPTCVSVCPVGAFRKDKETGAVVYESHKCIGCRYCMYACPFGIPRYEWGTPFPIVQKCSLCFERLQDGEKPACTEACPEQATIFGEREELLEEAHRRIQDHPGRYMNHVYGETEAGGTSVLYITKPEAPLDFLGFKDRLGVDPLPLYTHKWLAKVPTIGLGAAIGMTGLCWIIQRRNQLANGEPESEGGESDV